MSIRNFAALVILAVFVAGSKHDDGHGHSAEEHEKEVNKMGNPDYNTLTGVMVDYSMNGYDWPLTCKTGKKQSPVNLHAGFASTNTSLAIRAKAFEVIAKGTVKKNASNIALQLTSGQFDIIDPTGAYTEYTPYEAVIKSPSEHTVNDMTYDAELQLMFKKKGGASHNTIAGVSIFFDINKGGNMANPFIESLLLKRPGPSVKLHSLDTIKRGSAWPVSNVDVPVLLKKMARSTYWSYEGSITSPPCTEGVRWTVFEKVQPLQYEQAIAMREHFNYNKNWQGQPNGNNRGGQPLNRRYVYYGGASALVAGATALAVAALF